jgi:hypothetical protein
LKNDDDLESLSYILLLLHLSLLLEEQEAPVDLGEILCQRVALDLFLIL